MIKEEIRREFLKLKNKGHSYAQCKNILKATYSFETTIRTLKRWVRRLDEGSWNLKDNSKRPHTIHYKINDELKTQVVKFRKKTGWGEDKLALHFPLSHTAINIILNERNLCRETKNKGKRLKWVRWQRDHPNSLWQIDHTDEQTLFSCYTLSVLDDCSRYSLALVKLKHVTTRVVTHILDNLIKIHGKPREILTDNGSAYGSKSKHSKFDRWCRRRGIRHIRTKIHSPTTNGKVERLFKTMDSELEYCNNDLELFRMRYNNSRPHKSLQGKNPADIYFSFYKLF